MNTKLISFIEEDNNIIRHTFKHKELLEERLYYLKQYGSLIKDIQIGEEFYIYELVDELIDKLDHITNAKNLKLSINKQKTEVQKLYVNCLTKLNTIEKLEINYLKFLLKEDIDLLKNLSQLISLDLEIIMIQSDQFDFKYLWETLSNFKGLEILRLQLFGATLQKYQATQIFMSSFIVLPNIKELNLTFEYQIISDISFKQLQKNVLQFTNLESLKLSFMNSNISSQLFSPFFVALKKAKLNYREFHIIANIKADEKLFTNIKAFLQTQKNLQKFEISGFLFNERLIDPFCNIITPIKTLKNISVDIYSNKLRNKFLRQISSSFIQLKQLQTVRILFDDSVYSGDSMIQLGEGLKSISDLKDLRMEFPGKVREDVIKPFAECIGQCKNLIYLYILFSGSGKNNVVEFISHNTSSTIFDNPHLILSQRSYGYTSGCQNNMLFNYVIANQFKNIKHVETKVFRSYKLNQQFKDQIKDEENKLINKLQNLETLSIGDNYVSNQSGFKQLLEKNQQSLISFISKTNFDLKIFFQDINTKLFVLKMPISNFDAIINVFDQFPNLIDLDIGIGQSYVIYFWKFTTERFIIQSDLINFEFVNKNFRFKPIQLGLTLDCVDLRKQVVFLMIIYYKYIQEHIIYQQDLSHLDLWLDLCSM